LIWADLCRATSETVTAFSRYFVAPPASAYQKLPMAAAPPIVLLQPETAKLSTTPGTLGASGIPLTWCTDFFLAYGLLYMVDRKCFHLVPGHIYPVTVVTTLRDLAQTGMIWTSTPVTSNLVPANVFLLLAPQGEALLRLLTSINMATLHPSRLGPFRPALYYWIRDAMLRGQDTCTVQCIGEGVQCYIDDGIMGAEHGGFFASARAYLRAAIVQGIFRKTSRAGDNSMLTLQEPFTSLWAQFQRDAPHPSYLSNQGLATAACGPATVDALLSTLSKLTKVERMCFGAALIQLDDKSVRKLRMYHLGKLLGFSSSQCQWAAQKAGLLSGADTPACRLTPGGTDLVRRFQRALERKT